MKKNLKQLEDKVVNYIFLAPSIVILGLFMLYPIVWAFIASFKNIKLVDMVKARGIESTFTVPGKFTGLENYINVFKDENFLNALINMAYLAIIYIPITIALSILLAVLLNQKLKGTNFFRTALFVPYIVSLVSAGLLFKFLFQGDGLVNGVLQISRPDANFDLAGPLQKDGTIELNKPNEPIKTVQTIAVKNKENGYQEGTIIDIDGCKIFRSGDSMIILPQNDDL